MLIELISYTPDPDALCAQAAAICTGAKDKEKALRAAMESGHYSVLEHVSFTFKVDLLSRVALAQDTRHRLASFSVKGQRYCDAEDEYVIPSTILDSEFYEDFIGAYSLCRDLYLRMAKGGIPREDARYILPQAVATSFYMTMNARELLHFFELRCCNRAQWEIRQLADQMLSLCKEAAPFIFEKAGPPCVTGQCREVRPCENPRGADEWGR